MGELGEVFQYLFIGHTGGQITQYIIYGDTGIAYTWFAASFARFNRNNIVILLHLLRLELTVNLTFKKRNKKLYVSPVLRSLLLYSHTSHSQTVVNARPGIQQQFQRFPASPYFKPEVGEAPYFRLGICIRFYGY